MSSPRFCRHSLSAFALMVPLLAAAQTDKQPTTEAKPVPSKSLESAISYQSAFDDYKNFQDGEVMPWKAANNIVRDADSMAGHNMGTMNAAGDQEAKGKMSNQDMKNMPKASVPGEKSVEVPGAEGSKRKGPMGGMPGHDMSKMKQMDQQGKPEMTPALKPKDNRGSAKMGNMAGHDMGSMKATTKSAEKFPVGSKSGDVPDPKPEMNHSDMKKQ
jgi:hypothetical protein